MPAGVDIEAYPTTGADSQIQVVADSHAGGHKDNSTVSVSLPSSIDQLGTGQFDRGEFNIFSATSHTLDGSFLAFACGTGCEFQASAIAS